MSHQRLFPSFPLPSFGHFVPSGKIPPYGHILDDWADNRLYDRLTFAEIPLEFPRPISVYKDAVTRPEWTICAGTPSAHDSILDIPAGTGWWTQFLRTSLGITVGTWSIMHRWLATPTTRNDFLHFIVVDTCVAGEADANHWAMGHHYDGRFLLVKSEAGVKTTVIEVTKPIDTEWHEWAVKRDANGNFELFYDGVSVGTYTDPFLPPTPHGVIIRGDTDVVKYWDSLKVY